MRHDGPRARERAREVQVEHPCPRRLVGLDERPSREASHARDEHVEAPTRLHDPLGERGHRGQARGVHGLGDEAPAVGLGHALPELLALPLDRVRHGDRRALGEEAQRHRLAEGAGAPGDDRDAGLERPIQRWGLP